MVKLPSRCLLFSVLHFGAPIDRHTQSCYNLTSVKIVLLISRVGDIATGAPDGRRACRTERVQPLDSHPLSR